MNNRPLVTIAIPIFNAGNFLEFAIQSVVNQTYTSWELLLMEDGSTDNSSIIARRFSKIDERIKFISDGSNKGLVYRLNQSIQLAKGDYYARMDADDVMMFFRIEKQVNIMLSDETIDVLGSSTMFIDSENNISGSRNMSGNVIAFIHPSVLGKTEWFRNNPYDPTAFRVEDKDLWYRTSYKSHFVNIEEPLMFYRAFGTSSSSQTFKSNMRQRKLFKKYKTYHKSLIWCIRNIAMSYVRDLIFLIIPLFGGDKVFEKFRRRNPVPTSICLTKDDLKRCITSKN